MERGRPLGGKLPEIGFCSEKARLLNEFLEAVRESNGLQAQQTRAVIDGDPDFARFDALLHIAQEQKERAKYAWIAHVEEHGCCKEGDESNAANAG
jgi:hypothetical protein